MFPKTYRPLILLFIVALALAGINTAPAQAQGADEKERLKIEVKAGGRALDVITQLRKLKLVPSGGAEGLRLPRTIISVRQPGNWFFPIGRGTRLRNFVLQFELRAAQMIGETNGCGMLFRAVDDDNLSFVMLTRDRRVVLVQLEDGDPIVEFDENVDDIEGIDASDYELDEESIHIVTVVAMKEMLIVFLNGLEITTQDTAKDVRGIFATRLSNEEGNTRDTTCRYSNVWAWSYDK